MSPATTSQSIVGTDAPLSAVDAESSDRAVVRGRGPRSGSRARPGHGRRDRPRARLQGVRRASLRPVRHADRRPELEGRTRRRWSAPAASRRSVRIWPASWRPLARWPRASGEWEALRLRFARDWPIPPATSTSPASRRPSPKGSRSREFNAGSYKTADPAPGPAPRCTIVLPDVPDTSPESPARIESSITRGRVLGECSNLARELANEPGNTLTPREFADARRGDREPGRRRGRDPR